jgi:acetolactate synthase I/II/III large subunit
MKYSDLLVDWLVEEGYTHCFFVGGGNVMHLLESARTRMICVPVIHEVAASIATEYFNELADGEQKAFTLVTAGPGVTNLVTGVAGAWLESREQLIIAGQARTDALSRGLVRQIGHQEVDGAGIMRPITKISETIEEPLDRATFLEKARVGGSGRKGPVFLEFCLDVTGQIVDESTLTTSNGGEAAAMKKPETSDVENLLALLREAERPLFLFGAGVDRNFVRVNINKIERLGYPVATTWNGADRFPNEHDLYAGRSNTYGMRWSNVLVQQSDLVIALGTRLGLQQTGFNWQKFVPVGKLVQVDIDLGELQKDTPRKDLAINADANEVLGQLIELAPQLENEEWRLFVQKVKDLLPVVEEANVRSAEYIEAFDFVSKLNEVTLASDQIIPCSSGGAFTTMMQAYFLKSDQRMLTDKGLASMGYGLSGAIGASFSNPTKRTVLVEGDGGFAQNLQEIGTVSVNQLNLKMFIFSNQGYASIRTTQKSYFNGNYVGCDRETGLGFPDWGKLFEAYDIPCHVMTKEYFESPVALSLLNSQGPAAFIVTLDPEQIFYPKVTSKVLDNGMMESNPIHLMTPELPVDVANIAYRYLPDSLRS